MGAATAARRAAIIGTGLIGQGWAIVFARMGWEVRLYDVNAAMLAEAEAEARQVFQDMRRVMGITNRTTSRSLDVIASALRGMGKALLI